MNPIIPPIWLYLFEVLSAFDVFLFVILIVLSICYGIGLIIYGIEEGGILGGKKLFTIILSIVIVCTILTIAIPSQETMIYMAALTFVTPDNVEYGVETVKNVFDYITERLGITVDTD